jgi:NhaA family Na+:H+ antiporter
MRDPAGKYMGVFFMYKLSCFLGFPAPAGVRARHIRMVGLMAGAGLTVALFVADVVRLSVRFFARPLAQA